MLMTKPKANREPQQPKLHTLSVTEKNRKIYPLAPGGYTRLDLYRTRTYMLLAGPYGEKL